MAAKLGSFRQSFLEKREREKLLSRNGGYSELAGLLHPSDDEDLAPGYCSLAFVSDKLVELWEMSKDVAVKAWEMGKSDPRKIIFSAKMGLALVLISLLIFLKQPAENLGRYAVWAILTVVVVFEFSIGATLSRGFNRGLGTLTAGGLALGMAELAELAGEWEEVFVIMSIFITGFIVTYAKLYPTLKPYEYGFRVFLLTYCFIMVSGYQTREFVHTAVSRFLLIALGASVCLVVNICIYPIWAGEDLHNLVVKNFMGVATSLEGCVKEYLNCVEYKRVPSKILTYQASDDPLYSGYRSAVESTSQEDSLVGFAIWEPPHGPYKMFNYPWKNYVKVSGALRHCAFTVMALHGCILSEIKAPPERRRVFHDELQSLGTAGAKLLRDLGNKVKRMEKLGSEDILYEVHEAAEHLQKKVDRKSYLLVNSDSWEIGKSGEIEQPQEYLSMNDEKNRFHECKSLSDLGSIQMSQSWDDSNSNMDGKHTPPGIPARKLFEKRKSWPVNMMVTAAVPEEGEEEESQTYENASALSLATFMSLLIEFAARLQNLVDSFEELSEKANFKEPAEPSAGETVGFWTRLYRCFKVRNRDPQLLA